MVYSFAPLAPVTPHHVGFFFVCIGIAVIILSAFVDEFGFETGVGVAIFVSPIILFAYMVSYHWTNQEVLYYQNQEVEAKFLGFQAEGYKEKSGKIYADRHFTYVVYEVNGNPVILHAQTGIEYPKKAILYGN